MAKPNNAAVIHAYRQLYRTGLQAIDYSSPGRYTLRDRLRRAFRKSHPTDFDALRVRNTVQFLRNAAVRQTLERKVLRSLLHTWWWQDLKTATPASQKRIRSREGTPAALEEQMIRDQAFDQFNHLVRMLNESMGVCIR